MAVSLKTDLRFPESGQHGHGSRIIHQKDCRAYEDKILEQQTEIVEVHKESIRVRNYWFQVLEDMLLEFEAMQKKTNGNSRRWRSVPFLPKNKEMML